VEAASVADKVKINRKDFLFLPGKGGSLTSVDATPMTGLGIKRRPAKAKVITSPDFPYPKEAAAPISESTRKKRNAITTAIASTRG